MSNEGSGVRCSKFEETYPIPLRTPNSELPTHCSLLHGAPDLLRGERQIEVLDAERLKGVHHGIGNRRRGGDRRGLADPLDAEWVERGGRLCPVRLELREEA